MNPNLNREDIKNRLEKILRLDKLCLALFNACNIPTKIKLSDKDGRQIEYGFLAVFFMSNFAPDKKFAQHLSGNKISPSFGQQNFSCNNNYWQFKEFVCENKSKEFVNSEIWRIAYEQMVTPVKRFFESADNDFTEPVTFFIRQVVNVRNLPNMHEFLRIREHFPTF